MSEDPLIALLKANPGCRVTINFSPRKSTKPKPPCGTLKQKGRSWYRWDYERRDGCAVVNRRGGCRWSWHFEREATSDEYAKWKADKKAAKALGAKGGEGAGGLQKAK